MTEQQPAVTVKRRNAEVVQLHISGDYVVFVIDHHPDQKYFALYIESSYGGFAYGWSHPGKDFYAFLADLNLDYVGGKMCSGEREVFDAEATREGLLKELESMHQSAELEEEREQISGMDNEFDFACWAKDTKLFKDYDLWHDFYCTCPGRRRLEFNGLYKKFWPAFAKVLMEMSAEKAAATASAG